MTNEIALKAMSRAARALSRPGLAEIIACDKLGPTAVFYRLCLSLHPQAARHASIIVLAGALAARDVDHEWARDAARLCKALIGDGALFGECLERARAFAA